MKVLMVGDVVSRVGRDMLKKYLPVIIEKQAIDFTIVNGENVTHGKGINKDMLNKLVAFGADAVTLGNHAFKKESSASLFESTYLIRPYNLHKKAVGVGTRVYDVNGIPVRVTNLLGRVFLGELNPTNPFDALEEIIQNSTEKVHIVDFHAQATGEKLSLAWAFDGKVSAVLGTHTHVQTADERLLSASTAYISDVGMCGAYNGIIGSRQNEVIYRTWTGLPASFDVAQGEGQFSAVCVEIDEETGKAINIERIMITPDKQVGF